jgi:hypothetical protein
MGPDVNVAIVWRRKAEREAAHLFSYGLRAVDSLPFRLSARSRYSYG